MNYCNNCGAQLNNDGQLFCGKCGARVNIASASQGNQNSMPPQSPYTQHSGQNQNAVPPQSPYTQQTAQNQNAAPQSPYAQQSGQNQNAVPPQSPYAQQSGQNRNAAPPQSPYTQQTEQNRNTVPPYSQQQFAQNQFVPPPVGKTEFSMGWFKFLIYFALFAGAVVNVMFSINYLTGSIYLAQSNGEISAAVLYSIYGSLRAVDVIYGILLLALAGLGVYTRFRLAQYRKDGPKLLYILYGAGAASSVLYCIAVLAVSGMNQLSAVIGSLGTSAVMVIVNIKYFNERKELFVN